MDINLQIKGIKSTIDNMKLQIENIEIQNNNPMFQMMMNPVGDQLLNLSIQMLNSGFQLFNYAINLTMNGSKFFMQLQKISEQINSEINSFNIKNMNQQMIQQQMLQQQMMQQQMMQQQILNQQMMQPQIEHNQNGFGKKLNVIFLQGQFGNKRINLIVGKEITIKQLLDKYMDEVYGYENEEIVFVCNAKIIERNNNSKVLDYIKIFSGTTLFINVSSIKNLP